jgi:transcriptional regulator with XRE-family HTH domain
MATEFGAFFRRIREDLRFSMGQVARHLGVSVSYVSDVELGKRAPFTDDRIKTIAAYFGIKPEPMIEVAGRCRGFFEIHPQNQMQFKVGAALARRFGELSDDQLAKLQEIVGEEDD